MRAVRRDRILALDLAIGQVADALGPEHERPELGRANQQQPDSGMVGERTHHVREALVELLERRPALDVGEIDEGEVARGADDEIGPVARRLWLGRLRECSLRALLAALLALAERAARDAAGAGRPGQLAHKGVHHAPLLELIDRSRDFVRATHQLPDGGVEWLAVALQERRAERLAVVRQDHEVVRPRRVLRGPGQAAQRAIHAVERLQALRTRGAAVMGDLVIVGIGDVDRVRATEHLLDHQAGHQRPHDDVGDGAQQRIREAARVEPWRDTGQTRAACLEQFLGHLGNAQHDGVDEAVRTQEEAEVAAAGAQALARIGHRAQRQVRARRAAREQVTDARSVITQQSRVARLDQTLLERFRVRGAVRHEHRLRSLVIPAEGRDVVVVAEQDACLAGRGL